jgi:ATP-dependent helicase/DNAse subunit B
VKQLTHPEAVKKFQAWVKQHRFTPTELDHFQSCPTRFFVESLLGVRPDPVPDIELSPSEIGVLVHKVLERFMSRMGERLYTEGATPELKDHLAGELEHRLRKVREQRPQLSAALLQRQQKLIHRTLQSFLEQEETSRQAQQDLRPRYFEWVFGELKLADSELKISGRIDRIDIDEKKRRFLVIDYKTGSTRTTGGQILRGESFQLPLYILAVKQQLLPDYEPIGGVYYHLSDMSKKDGLLHAGRLPEGFHLSSRSSSLVKEDEWDRSFQQIAEHLGRLVKRILSGDFEPAREPCRTDCPLQFYCQGL